jgi:hypothetical protein
MDDEIVKASYNRKVKYLKRRSKALKRVLRGKFKKAMRCERFPFQDSVHPISDDNLCPNELTSTSLPPASHPTNQT